MEAIIKRETLRQRAERLFAKHGAVRDATLTEFAKEWVVSVMSWRTPGDRDDIYASIARDFAATEFKTAYLWLVRQASVGSCVRSSDQ